MLGGTPCSLLLSVSRVPPLWALCHVHFRSSSRVPFSLSLFFFSRSLFQDAASQPIPVLLLFLTSRSLSLSLTLCTSIPFLPALLPAEGPRLLPPALRLPLHPERKRGRAGLRLEHSGRRGVLLTHGVDQKRISEVFRLFLCR